MEHPDPKKHQLISFLKSGIRIAGSVLAIAAITNPTLAIILLAGFYGIAEGVGIYEELV